MGLGKSKPKEILKLKKKKTPRNLPPKFPICEFLEENLDTSIKPFYHYGTECMDRHRKQNMVKKDGDVVNNITLFGLQDALWTFEKKAEKDEECDDILYDFPWKRKDKDRVFKEDGWEEEYTGEDEVWGVSIEDTGDGWRKKRPVEKIKRWRKDREFNKNFSEGENNIEDVRNLIETVAYSRPKKEEDKDEDSNQRDFSDYKSLKETFNSNLGFYDGLNPAYPCAGEPKAICCDQRGIFCAKKPKLTEEHVVCFWISELLSDETKKEKKMVKEEKEEEEEEEEEKKCEEICFCLTPEQRDEVQQKVQNLKFQEEIANEA